MSATRQENAMDTQETALKVGEAFTWLHGLRWPYSGEFVVSFQLPLQSKFKKDLHSPKMRFGKLEWYVLAPKPFPWNFVVSMCMVALSSHLVIVRDVSFPFHHRVSMTFADLAR